MSRTRIIFRVSFCLYIAAVAFLCFAKPDDLPQMPQFWFGLPADKVGHFLMFVPFTPLAFMAFSQTDLSFARHLIILAAIMAAGFGVAVGTELIQAQSAYRSAEAKDILADCTGLLSGGICVTAYLTLQRKR